MADPVSGFAGRLQGHVAAVAGGPTTGRSNRYDAVIVGGGHNGLVCGTYLAKAGLSVCVLERRPIIGGGCVTEELWPGYRVSTAAHLMGLLQPKVILDLELAKFGFEVLTPPPVFQPLADGRHIVLWPQPERFCAELAKFSARDAAAYPAYAAHLRRLGAVMQRLLWEIPPDPGSRRLADLKDLLLFAWRFRDVGGCFYDLYDLMTLSAFDYLARWFESDAARIALGYYPGGAAGQTVSIRTPGTAFLLLRAQLRDSDTPAGGTGLMRGGMGSIVDALVRSGQRFGLEVRANAEVRSILVRDGRARGVALASGEEIAGKIVIANADARRTFLSLLDPATLPAEFVRGIRDFRATSTAFKIHLAVDRLPRYPGFEAAAPGYAYPAQMRVAPSVDYLEAAYDDMRRGQIARQPYLTVLAASAVDATLAPPGKHVLSIYGGHVPFRPEGGTWEGKRDDIFAAARSTLEQYAPGFAADILHTQILAPTDFEDIFGLPGGHPHHAEITLDQLFFRRPAAHYANYRSPVAALYLASASCHPGGAVTGVPGHNAARVILRDWKSRRLA